MSGLGRRSKPADILFYLLRCEDPFPVEEVVFDATGTKVMHVDDLVAQGLILEIRPCRWWYPWCRTLNFLASFRLFLTLTSPTI